MTKHPKLWQPILLATTISIGFGVVWMLVIGWAWGIAFAGRASETFVLQTDGTWLIQYDTANLDESRLYRDVDGKTIVPAVEEKWLSGVELGAAQRAPQRAPWSFPKLSWSGRIHSVSVGLRPPFYWYLIHDGNLDGSAYFVGYDSSNNVRVGYIGTAGFHQEEPPADERFPMDARSFTGHPPSGLASIHQAWSFAGHPNASAPETAEDDILANIVYLHADDTVFEVDLKARTVRSVFESESDSILSINLLTRYTPEAKLGRRWLAIRTANRVVVLNHKNEQLRDFVIPRELQNKTFTWYEIDDGRAVAQVTHFDHDTDDNQVTLHWISDQGAVARSEDLTLRQGAPPLGGEYSETLLIGLFFPAPIIVNTGVFLIYPLEMWIGGPVDTFQAALAASVRSLMPALIEVNALAAILAWMCYRRQKRYAVSPRQAVVWTIFVFLFGLPGFVGYLYHRRWPVLESCPACDRTVPHDRQACSSCSSDFPEPATIGTEVYV